MTFKQKFAKISVFVLEKIIVPILIVWITILFVNPPIQPEIVPEIAFNTGLPPRVSGPFRFDFTYDRTPWITFKIENKGSGSDEDLLFSLSLPGENKIKKIYPDYAPEGLKERVAKSERKANSFTEKFSSFPSDCSAQYRFELESFPVSTEHIKFSLISKFKNWTKRINFPFKNLQNSFSITPSAAFAEEPTRSDQGWSDQTPWPAKTPMPSKSSSAIGSGISLSGYDPVIMTNGLFKLLQDKAIISSVEAFQIKNEVESSKGGVLFGGVNVLKFCDVALNTLISKGIITQGKAKGIVEQSQKAGGVLVNGYNVIALQVGILNVLLENKKITLGEGQMVIDQAKSKP
jgi:hypothetical protein